MGLYNLSKARKIILTAACVVYAFFLSVYILDTAGHEELFILAPLLGTIVTILFLWIK